MSEITPPNEVRSYQMIIDGDSVPASNNERFNVRFPYTGNTWATAPIGTAEDVSDAVDAAKRRYESDEWQSMTPTDRGKLLYSLADVLEEHANELARLQSFSNGKLLRAMRSQANALPDWYRYYAGLADKISGRTIPVDDSRMFNFTLREPYGVIGAVAAWNSPLMLASYKIAPAIAAGNTVVLKPSEITPISAIRFGELMTEAGFPPGVLNVVTGFGETGAALTNHEHIQKLAFTGGPETGRKVGEAAGQNIVPVTLELGGKSPNIIFPDADFDNAITGVIKGIFAATGQTCVAGSRLLLHENIYDEFLDELVEITEELTLGNPLKENTEIAPLAFEGQFEKVEKYVDIALEEGATLITGGESKDDLPGDLFYPPTIFKDVRNEMRIAQEEVFGPVLSVIPFSDESEVIEIANDIDYGLAAGVWTNDLQRTTRMMRELEAGVVWVNTYRKSSFTTPFGGQKDSGIGIEKGEEVMEQYLQTKSVWIETEGTVSNPFQMM